MTFNSLKVYASPGRIFVTCERSKQQSRYHTRTYTHISRDRSLRHAYMMPVANMLISRSESSKGYCHKKIEERFHRVLRRLRNIQQHSIGLKHARSHKVTILSLNESTLSRFRVSPPALFTGFSSVSTPRNSKTIFRGTAFILRLQPSTLPSPRARESHPVRQS